MFAQRSIREGFRNESATNRSAISRRTNHGERDRKRARARIGNVPVVFVTTITMTNCSVKRSRRPSIRRRRLFFSLDALRYHYARAPFITPGPESLGEVMYRSEVWRRRTENTRRTLAATTRTALNRPRRLFADRFEPLRLAGSFDVAPPPTYRLAPVSFLRTTIR